MNILLTGGTGTIGSEFKQFLENKNHSVILWKRDETPIDNYSLMYKFVKQNNIDILFHLAAITDFSNNNNEERWKVNYSWPSEIAWICKELNVKFIFASSAMVFSNAQQGPFIKESSPQENKGYGYEKRKAEEQILKQNPNSIIARLGWQISNKKGNTMIDSLDKEIETNGQINASSKWFPSCSFIVDTLESLYNLKEKKSGIYMINSNEKYSFYELVCKLKKYYNKNWNIIEVQNFDHNQIMIDERIKIRKLDEIF